MSPCPVWSARAKILSTYTSPLTEEAIAQLGHESAAGLVRTQELRYEKEKKDRNREFGMTPDQMTD